MSVIISCGTFAAAIIPEFTKIFTSSKSQHVQEIVNASREAGASLNIISGIIAGNFSAFWKGLVMVGLMAVAFFTSREGLDSFMVYPLISSSVSSVLITVQYSPVLSLHPSRM